MKSAKKYDQAEDEIQVGFFSEGGPLVSASNSWASTQPRGAGSLPLFPWVISPPEKR